MVTNPRYSCHSAPKQVCWWHHQICHLPRRPCSLSRRQPAEWGHQLALRSLCLRYSRLPMSMFALLSPSSASSTLPLPSCSNLFYSKGLTASRLRSELLLFPGCCQCFFFPLHFACTEQKCLVILCLRCFGFFSLFFLIALASHISATNDLDRDHWDWLQTQFCPVCRALRKHSKMKMRVKKRKHPLPTPPVCLSRQLCLSFVFLSVLCGSTISSCHSVPFIQICRVKNK